MSPALDASLHLLDLDRDATLADAKKARRELALIWHPDRFQDSEALRQRAEEKLKQINEAYENVSDYLRLAAPKEALTAASGDSAPAREDARNTATLTGLPIEALALKRSLGLDVGGDRFAEVLGAGTTVPCAAAKTFTNVRDFQSELTIYVRHGEKGAPASAATVMGTATFVDLPPGPRGFLRMQVVFAVDDQGTVAIGATDLDTGEPILVTTD